jgi:hypothetical protein
LLIGAIIVLLLLSWVTTVGLLPIGVTEMLLLAPSWLVSVGLSLRLLLVLLPVVVLLLLLLLLVLRLMGSVLLWPLWSLLLLVAVVLCMVPLI